MISINNQSLNKNFIFFLTDFSGLEDFNQSMSTLKDKTVQKEKAIKEIIETEKKFLQNIEDLRHYYLNPLKKCNLFSEHVIATFESNFDEIIFVSTELYEQLCFQKNQNHGFCFVALQVRFYHSFFSNHF